MGEPFVVASCESYLPLGPVPLVRSRVYHARRKGRESRGWFPWEWRALFIRDVRGDVFSILLHPECSLFVAPPFLRRFSKIPSANIISPWFLCSLSFSLCSPETWKNCFSKFCVWSPLSCDQASLDSSIYYSCISGFWKVVAFFFRFVGANFGLYYFYIFK